MFCGTLYVALGVSWRMGARKSRRLAEIPTEEPQNQRVMSMPISPTPLFGHENALLSVGLRQIRVWDSKSNGFAYVLTRLERPPAATCIDY